MQQEFLTQTIKNAQEVLNDYLNNYETPYYVIERLLVILDPTELERRYKQYQEQNQN